MAHNRANVDDTPEDNAGVGLQTPDQELLEEVKATTDNVDDNLLAPADKEVAEWAMASQSTSTAASASSRKKDHRKKYTNTQITNRKRSGRPATLYPVKSIDPNQLPPPRPRGRPRKYPIDEEKAKRAEEEEARRATSLAAQTLAADPPIVSGLHEQTPGSLGSLEREPMLVDNSLEPEADRASPSLVPPQDADTSSNMESKLKFLNYGQDYG